MINNIKGNNFLLLSIFSLSLCLLNINANASYTRFVEKDEDIRSSLNQELENLRYIVHFSETQEDLEKIANEIRAIEIQMGNTKLQKHRFYERRYDIPENLEERGKYYIKLGTIPYPTRSDKKKNGVSVTQYRTVKFKSINELEEIFVDFCSESLIHLPSKEIMEAMRIQEERNQKQAEEEQATAFMQRHVDASGSRIKSPLARRPTCTNLAALEAMIKSQKK